MIISEHSLCRNGLPTKLLIFFSEEKSSLRCFKYFNKLKCLGISLLEVHYPAPTSNYNKHVISSILKTIPWLFYGSKHFCCACFLIGFMMPKTANNNGNTLIAGLYTDREKEDAATHVEKSGEHNNQTS